MDKSGTIRYSMEKTPASDSESLTFAYEATLHYLYQLSARSRLGPLSIDSTQEMCARLDHPEGGYPIIHVAGTNGKGSVVHKTAAILSASGYRVGVFTSPHIASFRERIRVNSQLITKEAITRLVPVLADLAKSIGQDVSFFELTTLLAFCYFSEQKVDVAVIEVGMGGRLDSTNVVRPFLSVITSIGYDHMHILGNTLQAIAKEKGGIIKPGIPVLLGPSADLPILRSIAAKTNSPVYATPVKADSSAEEQNQALAVQAVKLLPPALTCSREAINEGLLQRPSCRFENLEVPFKNKQLTVVLDVAHNEDGLRQLLANTKSIYLNRPLFVLMCLSKEKKVEAAVHSLTEEAEQLFLTAHPHQRLMDASELRALQERRLSNHSNVRVMASLDEALLQLLDLAHKQNGVVLICGSFFHMAAVRHFLDIVQERDPCELNEKTHSLNFTFSTQTR